jgi:hypothetical protein
MKRVVPSHPVRQIPEGATRCFNAARGVADDFAKNDDPTGRAELL